MGINCNVELTPEIKSLVSAISPVLNDVIHKMGLAEENDFASLHIVRMKLLSLLLASSACFLSGELADGKLSSCAIQLPAMQLGNGNTLEEHVLNFVLKAQPKRNSLAAEGISFTDTPKRKTNPSENDIYGEPTTLMDRDDVRIAPDANPNPNPKPPEFTTIKVLGTEPLSLSWGQDATQP